MLRGVGHCHGATLRDSEERERPVDHGGIDHVGEIGHPGVERDSHLVPVGQTATPLVVADQPIPVRQRRQPVSPHGAVPLQIQMGQPVRGLHERRSASRFGERDPGAVGGRAEPDPLPVLDGWPPERNDCRFDGRHELVPPPVDRADHLLAMPVVAHRAARRFDPARESGLADEPIAPDVVEQFMLRHHPIAMGNQMDEDIEHPRLDVDRIVTAPQLEAHRVEHVLTEPNDAVARLRSRATRCHHLHPRASPGHIIARQHPHRLWIFATPPGRDPSLTRVLSRASPRRVGSRPG